MQYLFGDTELAARRLAVLATVFAEASRPFLRETARSQLHMVGDLGCGPGYTTHMLAEILQSDQTIGLDTSEHFLAIARQGATPRVSFALHDITTVPFPNRPYDLLYCRFLLTHLTEPQAVVARWAAQLQPQGLLLMEEVEWIRTGHPVFTDYLDILQALLRHQANDLYVGPRLDGLRDAPHVQRIFSQVRRLPVTNASAATMFSCNIQFWKAHPSIRSQYPPQRIAQLEDALTALTQASPLEQDIEWGMRQLVFERTP